MKHKTDKKSGSNKNQQSDEKKIKIYRKMGVIFLTAGVVSAIVFFADNSRMIPVDESGNAILKRNGYGEGERTEELRMRIAEKEETYTVTIHEQTYTEEELQKVFEQSEKALEQLVLGENQSPDEVRSNLNLVNTVPGTGISVSWELDRYDVIDLQGVLNTESLGEEGTLVGLKAVMTYGQASAEHSFYVRVYPPKLNAAGRLLKHLEEEVQRLDLETQTSGSMKLPDRVDGQSVKWMYLRNFRAAGIMLLGVVLSLFLYVSEREKEKEIQKRRDAQMIRDYPQIISTFTLFLGAGMPARNVWFRMAEDYERSKAEKGTREIYEEMVYTMHEMKGGANENECYERFGERCGLSVYRKFSSLLSQNLRKGTKGLAAILRQESEEAFEERKCLAQKLGEEAGTKMLLPMFLMLAVVLVMIIVPAFLSIQI